MKPKLSRRSALCIASSSELSESARFQTRAREMTVSPCTDRVAECGIAT